MLLCVLLSSSLYAATYSTSRTVSDQDYEVKARANWVFHTGEYHSKGPHTILDKPFSFFTVYELEYLNEHIDHDKYGVKQHFRPVYYNTILDTTTVGDDFYIRLTTNGPY